MKTRIACLFMCLFGAAATLQADDTLKLIAEKQPQRGVVTAMSPTEVTLKQGPLDKKFPVNEIDWIAYENEPIHLASARRMFLSGKYPETLAAIGRISADETKRPEIRQDVEFYKAASTAR